ncbi:MAG: 3-dehydroquinate synthase [Candidatus Omnitrophota bacterium]|nr:MAG: 3-dehydroquinate synthase [Candidatus Omnitrophota bacterium]
MEIIKVGLKENSHNIYIGYNILKNIPSYIKENNLGNLGLIITSRKVYSLYRDLIKRTFKANSYKIICVPNGEEAKSKKWLFEVIAKIIKLDTWNRKVFVICLGGGTVGDLGGFVASIYKRGIPYIQVPTTLLSQIDASIGGKTAIDLKEAKNILGTFYQPKAIFIDPSFIRTLPKRKFKEGMAEAIKYGVIKKRKFFYFLRDNYKKITALSPDYLLKLIYLCARQKAHIVKKDEKEKKGIRTILNFGHTFAHAVETFTRYKKLSHGEAVALGMVYAAQLSLLLGKCARQDLEQIKNIIKLYGLPSKIAFDHTTLCRAMSYDKKFISGRIRMVLLRKIGEVEVVEGISFKIIRKSMEKFAAVH